MTLQPLKTLKDALVTIGWRLVPEILTRMTWTSRRSLLVDQAIARADQAAEMADGRPR